MSLYRTQPPSGHVEALINAATSAVDGQNRLALTHHAIFSNVP
jgi:hypothetical protein